MRRLAGGAVNMAKHGLREAAGGGCVADVRWLIAMGADAEEAGISLDGDRCTGRPSRDTSR